MNRRNLLRATAGAIWAGAAGLAGQAIPAGKSRVVIARDPALRGTGGSIDSARVARLLDRAMQAYYGCDSPVEAWRKVVRPGEVVGLKVNCLAGRGNSTNVPLVNAICERLQQAGVQQILIFDRLNSDLESAGFRIAAQGRIRCAGNDTLGYEDELSIHGSAASLLAQAFTRICGAVINLPVLKDHGIVGVTMALKNMFGAIHNPNKYHVTVGDPYVADVNMFPEIRRKVRLTICDAIAAQYEGGPSFMPQWTWPYNGLLVSRDPVALDYTGWQIIENTRKEKGMPPLKAVKREPLYIATAADANHRLGTNDPRRIERLEV